MHKRLYRTPLEELSNDREILKATRLNYLTTAQIRAFLRQEPVIFVLASAGFRLAWHEGAEIFDLWKQIRAHICNDLEEGCALEDFPGGYFYFAVEWCLDGTNQLVIVLEHHH